MTLPLARRSIMMTVGDFEQFCKIPFTGQGWYFFDNVDVLALDAGDSDINCHFFPKTDSAAFNLLLIGKLPVRHNK